MNDTLARRSAHALSWSWAGAIARALLQFGVQVLLARLLGPEAFGQAAAALLVLGVAALVAEGGFAAALVQREPLRAADPGAALAGVLALSLPVAAATAAAALPLALLLGDARLVPLLLAAAAIVPLQALATLPPALLQRSLRLKRLQAIQFAAYALAYGVAGVALAAAGAGAWSLLAAFALHAAIVSVAALPGAAADGAGARPSWRPRLAAARELLPYAARTAGANLVNWALESVDRIVVSRFAGSAALGAYSVAATLARSPVTLLVGAAQPVAFASAARLASAHERIARGWLAMLSLALLVALPLFGWLVWFARPLVGLLYGPAWLDAALPLAWLAAGVPFFVMFALTGPLLRGVNAVGAETRAQLAVLVLLLPALLALAGHGVAVVAALVTLATALRAAALGVALCRRLGLPLSAPWRAGRGGALLLALVLLLAWPSRAALGDSAAAAACSAALALLALLPVLRWQGRALFGAELCLALANRRADSRLAAALCRWARLSTAR